MEHERERGGGAVAAAPGAGTPPPPPLCPPPVFLPLTLSGVLRSVHTGIAAPVPPSAPLGAHSKHSVAPELAGGGGPGSGFDSAAPPASVQAADECTLTCPARPAVPASSSGIPAAAATLDTARRAVRLSRALKTRPYAAARAVGPPERGPGGIAEGPRVTSPTRASTATEVGGSPVAEAAGGGGAREAAALPATRALASPTCRRRKRNWRFRLLVSILSRSMTVRRRKPARTRHLSSSQPMPPAPTTRTGHDARAVAKPGARARAASSASVVGPDGASIPFCVAAAMLTGRWSLERGGGGLPVYLSASAVAGRRVLTPRLDFGWHWLVDGPRPATRKIFSLRGMTAWGTTVAAAALLACALGCSGWHFSPLEPRTHQGRRSAAMNEPPLPPPAPPPPRRVARAAARPRVRPLAPRLRNAAVGAALLLSLLGLLRLRDAIDGFSQG